MMELGQNMKLGLGIAYILGVADPREVQFVHRKGPWCLGV